MHFVCRLLVWCLGLGAIGAALLMVGVFVLLSKPVGRWLDG